MNSEYIKKGSLTMELTIEVDVNFAYNEDSLFNYYVWFNSPQRDPIDLYYGMSVENLNLIEEEINERINEIKYEE